MKSVHVTILSISFVLAFLVLGLMIFASRANRQNISSVGLASERFESDVVKWRVTLSRTVPIRELSGGYRQMRDDITGFRSLLLSKGLSDTEVTVLPVSSYPNYSNTGEPTTSNVQQGLFVITANLGAVESYALNPESLLTAGVTLQESRLEYFYSRLDDLKASLLSEAAKDAQRRANEIATATGVTLGPPASMRAGVFQIKEPYSAEVSDYGMFNTQTKRKEISVTVHASFRIE